MTRGVCVPSRSSAGRGASPIRLRLVRAPPASRRRPTSHTATSSPASSMPPHVGRRPGGRRLARTLPLRGIEGPGRRRTGPRPQLAGAGHGRAPRRSAPSVAGAGQGYSGAGAGSAVLVDVRIVALLAYEIHRRAAGKYARRSAAPPMAGGGTPGTVDARSSRQVAVAAFHPREELSDGYHQRAADVSRAGRARQPRRGRSRATTTSSAASGSRPTQGAYSANLTPGDGQAVHRGRRARRRRTSSSRSTPRTPRRTPWGEALADRARARAERDRRRDRGQPRDARGRRELGQRQAGARDAGGRHPAGGRPLPLLRRRASAREEGSISRDRQRHGRLPLPRAARRRRPDHPVQLPAADGGVEDRAGARRRQLHGGQAGEPDAVVDPEARRAHRRHRPAGRPQHRERPGRRDRQGARHEQAHRQDRVHRRDDDRPADHAVRRAEHHPVDDGARRQVAEHLLRRRDGRGRRVPRQGRSRASCSTPSTRARSAPARRGR